MNASPHARDHRLNILLCLLVAFSEGIDLQAAGVAAAGIVGEFKPVAATMGTFFSASTLGLFFGALIGGRFSDRRGRKDALVTSVIVFGVFSLLTACAWDMTSLTCARLLTGLGLGGALPNLIALVAESSSEHRRSANVAMVYAGTPLGGAAISLISMLSPTGSWRWMFIVGGIVPLLIVPIMMRHLSESPDFLAARASAGGGVKPVPAGRLFTVFAEKRALRTLLLWGSFFFAMLTLYLLLNWLPTLLVDKGLSKSGAGLAQIGFNVGGATACLLVGSLLESRWRRTGVTGMFIVLPLLLASLAGARPQMVEVALIVFLLGGVMMASQAFLYATSSVCYPVLMRGLGVGLAVAVGRIGSIAGPQWGGALKTMGYTSQQLLLSLIPVVIGTGICAVLLVWLLPPRAIHGEIKY